MDKNMNCKICGCVLPRSRIGKMTCYHCHRREGGEDIKTFNDYQHTENSSLGAAFQYLDDYDIHAEEEE